jgi:hypothetical protein
MWDEWIDEDTHKNFCMIPNAITDLLKVELLGFYVHLKRITGETGKCYQSSRTLAKNCKISLGSVVSYKKQLAELGLIHIISRKRGATFYDEIRIRDIWGKDLNAFRNSNAFKKKNATRSDSETKEDLVNNKEYLKEGQQKNPAAPMPFEADLSHPALKTYRHIARLHVPISWRKEVIETVGSDPEQLKKWEEIVRDWIGHGWKKTNISGMLECFAKGGIQNNKNGGHQKPLTEYPPGIIGRPDLIVAFDYIKYNAHHTDSALFKSSLEKLQKAGFKLPETK